jgi:hypothetical protein
MVWTQNSPDLVLQTAHSGYVLNCELQWNFVMIPWMQGLFFISAKHKQCNCFSIQKLAQVVMVLTCFQEVASSNLKQDTDYSDWHLFIMVLLSPWRQMLKQYLTLGHVLYLPFTFFPIHYSLLSLLFNHLTLHRVTDSTIK